MNGNEMLDLIGDVEENYVMEAQRHREDMLFRSHRSPWKFVLIAAILSVLLAGCAVVYALRLENMKVGQDMVKVPGQSWHGIEIVPDTEETIVLRSMQGDWNSPNNQAMQEWLRFRESYDPDRSLMIANNRNEFGIPEKYYFNGCYTWEMAEKMEEILGKYGLDLVTNLLPIGEYQELLDYMGIEGIFRDGVKAESIGCDVYEEGIFGVSAGITLTGEETGWKHQVMMRYHYSLKAYLDMELGTDTAGYDEWDYTTSDGSSVLLALKEEQALILCDQGDAFISVRLEPWTWAEPNDFKAMERADLEQFAEVFDFKLKPQPGKNPIAFDSRETEPVQTEYSVEQHTFVSVILDNLERTYYPEELEYTFLDLNGDGYAELILKILNQDRTPFLEIWSETDGEAFIFNVIAVDDICEGNFVASCQITENMEQYEYYRPTETGLSFADQVAYSKVTDQWMHDQDGPWGEDAVVISEEEARKIMDSYPHKELDWKPISEYPLTQ